MPRSTASRLVVSAVAAVSALTLAACATSGRPERPAPQKLRMGERPNIVFVLSDDLSRNLVRYMPEVQKMEKDGTSLSNYFVTNSLCCPSRATTFTGNLPHNTGIFSNGGSDGGWSAFHARGEEKSTFATSLQKAGYRTGLFGKYLNKYPARGKISAKTGARTSPVPPGWSQWAVATNAYASYKYWLNVNGRPEWRGTRPQDHVSNQVSTRGTQFIKDSVRMKQPFMLELAPFAPHLPATPEPQDAKKYNGLKAPRGPSFNEADMSDKPAWLKNHRPLTQKWIRQIDQQFRNRVRSVQAVSRMIGQVRSLLKSEGIAKNTYVVFASDNGLHLGEHRLRQGKLTTFDIDIHVPLVAVGPKIKAGRTKKALADNTDLCPTFTDIGRSKKLPSTDGQSLMPLLTGSSGWKKRSAVLIEHHGPDLDKNDPDVPLIGSGNPPSYEAIRTRHAEYAEYNDGEREYYDLKKDPYELDNTWGKVKQAERQRLAAMVRNLKHCKGTDCIR
jgi:arylsulfatase A-like enzyme